MSASPEFPATYAEARRRFRAAAATAGWSLEAHETGEAGPAGEALTVDVASAGPPDASCVLIVSSGLHGVEGPLGSAVQSAAILQRRVPADGSGAAPLRTVFVHALNPYGFAWSRRTDSQNIDPNRNFLRRGEPYASDASAYRRFDALLNPRRPPGAGDFFLIRTLAAIARYGLPALKQALVTGQYEFPQGLFFGGTAPAVTHRLLVDHAERWIGSGRLVLHLDLHTGLGASGRYKLLVDDEMPAAAIQWLRQAFGHDVVEAGDPAGTSYRARGHLGHWSARWITPARRYLYACAEFGTHGNLAMLAALRAENQAHHYGRPGDPAVERAKARLCEMFCPPSPEWRRRAFEGGLSLVLNAMAVLEREPTGG